MEDFYIWHVEKRRRAKDLVQLGRLCRLFRFVSNFDFAATVRCIIGCLTSYSSALL